VARTRQGTDNNVLDVVLVRESAIREAGVPVSFPLTEPTLSGIVFESTERGKTPVAGARVTADYSGGLGSGPAANTITDRAGRYVLCGLQTASISVTIWVSQNGFSLREVPLKSGLSLLDVELPRQ
jgi:hypothetical protein